MPGPVDWDAAVLQGLEDVFAEPATYMPKGGAAPYQVLGVYDAGHRDVVLLAPQSPATTSSPVFGVRVAQFTTLPAKNDRLTIPSAGMTYFVTDVQMDGHGWAKLILSKSARQQ